MQQIIEKMVTDFERSKLRRPLRKPSRSKITRWMCLGNRDTAASKTTVAERGANFSGIPQAIYGPRTLAAAPGTASGFTRQPFAGNIISRDRFDPVTSRLIQHARAQKDRRKLP